MERKRPVGATILGWLIIVSNLYILCFNWWFIGIKSLTHIYWWISPIAVRLEMLMFVFPANPVTHYFELFWAVVLTACGVGILRGKNLARIVFILCCGIQAIASLLYYLWASLLRYISMFGLWQGILKEGIADIMFGILPSVIAVIYIVVFTRPKVKEQFK